MTPAMKYRSSDAGSGLYTLPVSSKVRRALLTILVAPALSVLSARLMASSVGDAGLGGTLPVGVHTYLPLADLVALPAITLFSLAMLALAALLLLRWRFAGVVSRPRDLFEFAAMTAAMQVALFAVQLIVVEQLQGVPDAGLSLALAAVAQTTVAALLTSGTLAVGVVIRLSLLSAPTPARAAVVHRHGQPQQAYTRRPAGVIRRRGPPVPLLS
jgi:hypothetical protein